MSRIVRLSRMHDRFATAAELGRLRGTIKLTLLTLETAQTAHPDATRTLIADAIAGLRLGLEMAGEASA